MNIARAIQFFKAIPDALKYKSILYIGASKRRAEMLSYFIKNNFQITIIEAWTENIYFLKRNYPRIGIIQADIRNVAKIPLGYFDIIMWWHGPEHVEKEALPGIFEVLDNHARKALVLACPWGRYDQEAVDGNPFERHRSRLYPKFFEKLGFKTSTIGTKDKRGSNLLAWKKL